MSSWIKNAVFYQIYPSSFYDTNNDGYGDFKGIEEKLDYIKYLGCNAIWLSPCFDSPFRDGGYDVRDFFKVSDRFGTLEDLLSLLKSAHKLGIKIILDLVAGHTSEENEMFKKSASCEKNEFSDRFVWTKSPWDMPEGYRFISGRSDRYGNYLINFFSTQPAINYGFNKITAPWQMHYKDPECQKSVEWLKSVIKYWLDLGFDGFRVDMADYLVKNDDEKKANIELWQEIKAMIKNKYPEAILISEWSNPAQSLIAGFDADFILDHKGNCYNALLRYEQYSEKSVFDINGEGNILDFTDDFFKRFKNSSDNGFISFITCNHDTLRLAPDYSIPQLKVIYSFIFSLPGIPFLYYGDEIGMKYQKLNSKECGFQRTGSRTPMQWSFDKNMGFSKCDEDKLYLPVDTDKNICVETQINDKDSLLNVVKTIIEFKKSNPDFNENNFETIYAEKNKFPFVFKRGKYLIAVNPTNKEQNVKLNLKGKIVYSVGKTEIDDSGLSMQAISFLIAEIS